MLTWPREIPIEGDPIEVVEIVSEYGAWLATTLAQANLDEKIQALESVLPTAFVISRRCELPDDHAPGPLQTEVLEPLMIAMGKVVAQPEPTSDKGEEPRGGRPFAFWEEEAERP